MTFCGSCGTQVQDGIKFCPACGNEVAVQVVAQPGQTSAHTPTGAPGVQIRDEAWEAQEGKAMSAFAYVLFFVPLLTGEHKKNSFVRYHANQGTVLFIVTLAWGIAYWILSAILIALFFNPATWYTGAGWGAFGVITMILGLLWLVPAILCVIGIVHAVKGDRKPLPVIGKFTIIK
ncbi:MAG: zinc-ribbon domain-containing protein [Propionibacteriaceae bacterium]|jgi:uncharacterized membrane protein|nr:zinc-ribbon domain-containing protein [Propionibacteriaceae bacterium]